MSTWFCVLTLQGHTADGRPVTTSGRGEYAVEGSGVAMEKLLEHVHAAVMAGSDIADQPVIVFWYAAPSRLEGSA